MDDVVQEAEFLTSSPDVDVFEWRLANLTLQILPDVRVDNRCLLTVSLAFEPFLEAAETDKAKRTSALTRSNKLMLWQLLLTQTDSTDLALSLTAFCLRLIFLDQFLFIRIIIHLAHISSLNIERVVS